MSHTAKARPLHFHPPLHSSSLKRAKWAKEVRPLHLRMVLSEWEGYFFHAQGQLPKANWTGQWRRKDTTRKIKDPDDQYGIEGPALCALGSTYKTWASESIILSLKEYRRAHFLRLLHRDFLTLNSSHFSFNFTSFLSEHACLTMFSRAVAIEAVSHRGFTEYLT